MSLEDLSRRPIACLRSNQSDLSVKSRQCATLLTMPTSANGLKQWKSPGLMEKRPFILESMLTTRICLSIELKENIPGLIGKSIRAEIWHLRPGMEVLSRCEAKGEIAYRKVRRVFEHESREAYELTYSGEDEVFGPGSLVVMGNHKIWVIDKGWMKVKEMNVGEEFLTSDGTHSHLIALNKGSYRIPVYNIEVEDFRSYFVGGVSGLWVHNKNIKVTARAVDASKEPVSTALRGELGCAARYSAIANPHIASHGAEIIRRNTGVPYSSLRATRANLSGE